MRKPKLVTVTGFVALSYLVLIPVGAYIAWRKIDFIEKDLDQVWGALELPAANGERKLVNFDNLKRLVLKK
jgi:hypothetical protein